LKWHVWRCEICGRLMLAHYGGFKNHPKKHDARITHESRYKIYGKRFIGMKGKFQPIYSEEQVLLRCVLIIENREVGERFLKANQEEREKIVRYYA